MDIILLDCEGTICYIDDILVFGNDKAEMDIRLQKVLRCLAEADMGLHMKKCIYNVPSVEFLGHVVSADGVKPNPKNIHAIVNFPRPSNQVEVQRFLGMINYISKFLSSYSSVCEPLLSMT